MQEMRDSVAVDRRIISILEIAKNDVSSTHVFAPNASSSLYIAEYDDLNGKRSRSKQKKLVLPLAILSHQPMVANHRN